MAPRGKKERGRARPPGNELRALDRALRKWGEWKGNDERGGWLGLRAEFWGRAALAGGETRLNREGFE